MSNPRSKSKALLHLLLLLLVVESRSFNPVRIYASRRHILPSHILNSAFEWLADDRENKQPYYSSIKWLDPGSSLEGEEEWDAEMPLYPIGATYLPAKTTHYLNNMEPRNVQMALDLARLPMDRKFCVVLTAADTGRIASVGTVMTVVDIEVQRVDQDIIRKIRVTCQPVATVDIVRIVNPNAASWENRIKKSPDYLKARVQYRNDMMGKEEEVTKSILENYNLVRDLYLKGIGTQHLPPFAVKTLKDALPEWTESNFIDEVRFWESLEQWQTLCNTVRESQQMALSTDRNEIMVAAASAKGGPLKLPIHEADLSPDVRRQLQQMEVQAQQTFLDVGMDPCLDFQVLLSLPRYSDKVKFFATMISRELQRLQTLRVDYSITKTLGMSPSPPTKGAWFDDTVWESSPTNKVAAEVGELLAYNSTQVK